MSRPPSVDHRPSAAERAPVENWATDWDILDPQWVNDPFPVWDGLRTTCPIARTGRYHGVYLPTRYADIRDIAYDTGRFSSRVIAVREQNSSERERGGGPPITSDPPRHRLARMALLPQFTPEPVARLEPWTRGVCRDLIAGFAGKRRCDGAVDYAQHIPVMVIARMLGVPDTEGDRFRGWVTDIFQASITDTAAMQTALSEMTEFFRSQLPSRRAQPGHDLISALLACTYPDGQPFSENHVLGSLRVIMLGGIDTTWSSIGAAIWHLATHDADRRRLVAEPELIPTAIEEFLRAYAPVSMAREVTEDTVVAGCPMKKDELVLLAFPAANRDPEVFPDADKVLIDRRENRHAAFGLGIHRCLGSNLARMELKVALEELLQAVPEFRLDGDVVWSSGTVRGPRRLPLAIG
jgi:cytochrome P450